MSDFIESQEAAGSGASCLAWNVGPYQLPQLCQLCHLRQPPLPLPDRILGIELFALAKVVILIHRQILELGKSRSEFYAAKAVERVQIFFRSHRYRDHQRCGQAEKEASDHGIRSVYAGCSRATDVSIANSVIAGIFTFRVRRRNLSKCDRLLS